MRLFARFILMICLLISVFLQLREERTLAEPQVSAGCYTFQPTTNTCASGCTQVPSVIQTGEGSQKLVSEPVECDPADGDIPACTGEIPRAADNPPCCDRDGDTHGGNHPGCPTATDCDETNASFNLGEDEDFGVKTNNKYVRHKVNAWRVALTEKSTLVC